MHTRCSRVSVVRAHQTYMSHRRRRCLRSTHCRHHKSRPLDRILHVYAHLEHLKQEHTRCKVMTAEVLIQLDSRPVTLHAAALEHCAGAYCAQAQVQMCSEATATASELSEAVAKTASQSYLDRPFPSSHRRPPDHRRRASRCSTHRLPAHSHRQHRCKLHKHIEVIMTRPYSSLAARAARQRSGNSSGLR